MRKTPATEDRPTHRMNTPCRTTTDVTVEGLLFSKGRGKEEAGDTDVGIGGDTGGTNQNGAEETSLVFVELKGEIMVCGGCGRNRKCMMCGRLAGLIGLIHRNLDGRRDQRDTRHVALYQTFPSYFNFTLPAEHPGVYTRRGALPTRP